MYRLNRLVLCNSKPLKNVIQRLSAANGTVASVSEFSSKASGEESVESNSNATTATGEAFPILVSPPDREISLFGPKDHRAPLPGNVGLFPQQNNKSNQPQTQTLAADCFTTVSRTRPVPEGDVVHCELNVDRQVRILDQLLYPAQFEEESEDKMKSQDVLECVAHECPDLLCRDFQELFPGRTLGRQTTVITVCQKTKTNMNAWSPDMEIEREELMEHFMEMAQSVTTKLNAAGYWADYVDPFSGRPYLGAYTNATLFETDERYRHFGFDIEDLGCCKIISHHAFGTRAFVGSVFTNAPINSRELREVIRMITDGDSI